MQPTIFIVHDDDAVRASLAFFLETHGWTVSVSCGSTDFLRDYRGKAGCLVLTQDMQRTNGLACLSALRRGGVRLPAIVRMMLPTAAKRRRAKSLGALLVDALSVDVLPDAIRQALDGDPPRNRG